MTDFNEVITKSNDPKIKQLVIDTESALMSPCQICHHYFMEDEDMFVVNDRNMCSNCFNKKFPTDQAWNAHILEHELNLSDEIIENLSDAAADELATLATENGDAENYYTTAANDALPELSKTEVADLLKR